MTFRTILPTLLMTVQVFAQNKLPISGYPADSVTARLNAATVTGHQPAGIESTRMGAVELPLSMIRNTPVLMGEADVLKTVQLLPGVQSGAEGFSGIYVRGGGPDENMILLDGVPIYNVSHLLGVFSVFTPEAVKKVTLYKSSFPARYSGRISSIIDVQSNDGNLNEMKGSVSVGMLSDKFHLEGPIVKDKSSYSVSFRGMHTFFIMPVVNLFLNKDADRFNYAFYDINAKVCDRIGNKDRLYFNFYNGKDAFTYNGVSRSYSGIWINEMRHVTDIYNRDYIRLKWGNTVLAGRWNHVFGGNLFLNTSLSYNSYRMRTLSESEYESIIEDTGVQTAYEKSSMNYRSGIDDISLRADFDYSPGHNHAVKFGAIYTHHIFRPETTNIHQKGVESGKAIADTSYSSKGTGRLPGDEYALYLEDDFRIGDHIFLNPGVHLALFSTQGKNYLSLQPRFSARYAFADGYAVKAGYSRMAQYVHLLSSTQWSLPTDLWVPITAEIKPVTSDQYSLGLYYSGMPGWEFSVEGYFKKMENVLEYRDGALFISNSTSWENNVAMGEGRAKGIEFFAQKTAGNTTGWVAYTLSKSDRRFADGTINGGDWFPYRYDKRHNISICVNHKFNERVDLSGTWVLASGGYMTVPERQTFVANPLGDTIEADYISGRNNYKLPPSHRLDLSLNLRKQKKHGERVWNFGIYNVYGHANPNWVVVDYKESKLADGTYQYDIVLNKRSFLMFLPSFSYTFNF